MIKVKSIEEIEKIIQDKKYDSEIQHIIEFLLERTKIANSNQDILLKKYLEIKGKMNSSQEKGNKPMYLNYKKELKTIRMTLELLGINIQGINQ